MNKVDLKWDYEVENNLFKHFRKLSYSNLKRGKISLKNELQRILKEFVNFSVGLEKKYRKTKNIDLKRHFTLATKQINDVAEWQKNIREYISKAETKEGLQEKLLNNAKFRARNMQGNYYRDFLKEIVAEESEYFKWNTVGDERVRPEHQDRDGEIYEWEKADLLPGEDPGCRCWATVYFPDDWEKQFINN